MPGDNNERWAAIVGLATLAIVLCFESLAVIHGRDSGDFVRASVNWSEPVMRIVFVRER